MTENKIFATDFNCTFKVLDDFLCFLKERKHRLTRAHREKQLKMSCQALHNAPPNRT